MRPYRKKKELANWIRRKLGSPLVDVLIDSTQIDDCIDQACDYFGEFAGGIGNEDSIILICPEPVLYDGTGTPCQPGPTRGKWRKTPSTPGSSGTSGSPFSTPTTSNPPSSTCPPGDCGSVNTNCIKPPLAACTNPEPAAIDGVQCQAEADCRGPGWCGDGTQAPHCFTETEKSDPDAIGPYWVEGDTTVKPSKQGMVFQSVYDVPNDVTAVHAHLGAGYFGTGAIDNSGEALFSPMWMLLGGGGSWGMQSPTTWTDSRYGSWMGANGGFVDVVGWEMGMQYLEMFRTLYSTKLNVQLLEQQHKVRISPPPTGKGVIAFACTRRVADEFLYEHQFVREYALAHCLIQVGMNSSKYSNANFPGGGSINGELYLTRGDALREKLEQDLDQGKFQLPPDFYMG